MKMKKADKNFIILIGIGAIMVIGIIAENTASVLNPKSAVIKIDVEKVKREIDQAGLIPREAVHWREL